MMMHGDDVRWISQRSNEVAFKVGSALRAELMAHYGAHKFPPISIQARYEEALDTAMKEAFERGYLLGQREAQK